MANDYVNQTFNDDLILACALALDEVACAVSASDVMHHIAGKRRMFYSLTHVRNALFELHKMKGCYAYRGHAHVWFFWTDAAYRPKSE